MSHSRTILVTGATGFIGRALCAALHRRGEHVIALSRDARRARQLLGADVEPLERLADIPPSRRIDAIVNLAGEPLAGGLWTATRKQVFVDSRVNTTLALVGLIGRLETQPPLLINGSAIGFYGERGDETLDETSGPAPGFMSELCQQWESAAAAAQDHGTRVCLLRTGLVLGADGGLLAPLLLSSRLGLGAVMGNGQQWNAWIHLEDEIGIILHLLDHPTLSGPINAVAPHPVRQVELMKILAQQLHRPQWLRIPRVALRMAGEMSELFLISQRVLPVGALAAGYRFRYSELQQAIQAIAG